MSRIFRMPESTMNDVAGFEDCIGLVRALNATIKS
jgi:hypothetical protein